MSQHTWASLSLGRFGISRSARLDWILCSHCPQLLLLIGNIICNSDLYYSRAIPQQFIKPPQSKHISELIEDTKFDVSCFFILLFVGTFGWKISQVSSLLFLFKLICFDCCCIRDHKCVVLFLLQTKPIHSHKTHTNAVVHSNVHRKTKMMQRRYCCWIQGRWSMFEF